MLVNVEGVNLPVLELSGNLDRLTAGRCTSVQNPVTGLDLHAINGQHGTLVLDRNGPLFEEVAGEHLSFGDYQGIRGDSAWPVLNPLVIKGLLQDRKSTRLNSSHP